MAARASLARVRRAADGAVLCERCEIPESSFGRMRGLLGRNGLEPGSGMLIDRAPSVHMFFMRFPIDVVFLDRDRKVVRVVSRLRPWRVAGARRAVAALELPAGAAAAAAVETGDVLILEDIVEISELRHILRVVNLNANQALETGQSPAAAAERRLARLAFDIHDGPLQELVLLAEDLRLAAGQIEGVLAEADRERVR